MEVLVFNDNRILKRPQFIGLIIRFLSYELDQFLKFINRHIFHEFRVTILKLRDYIVVV